MGGRAARPAAIGFVLATVTLDILAMSVVIPVLPRLVLAFQGNNPVAAAHAQDVFGTAWALMQFVFSPVLGALSDRFGRRPVILLSNLGLGLDYILMALAPDLRWLFVGRVISGITAASFSSANAYIADITPPEMRAARFGLVSVAFGFGFVAGPALGGVLGSIDPRLPFWVAGGLSLTNFLFGLFVLPESLPPERRTPFHWRRANPVGALRLILETPKLGRLSGVYFLYSLAHGALPNIVVLYVTVRFGWSLHAVGLMMAAIGVSSALVGGVLTGPVVRRLGERRALFLGLCFGAIGMAAMAAAQTGPVFLAAIMALALWGFTGPALGAMMSATAGPAAQGRLGGATGSLMGIAALIGPSLYNESFAVFSQAGAPVLFPGMPFMISAGLIMCAIALLAWRRLAAKV